MMMSLGVPACQYGGTFFYMIFVNHRFQR